MAENTGELERCNEVFVTYYWTLPASGPHLYTNIILIIISIFSALFGSIANVLVILSYFKSARVRTLYNVPLLSLSSSDLLVTAVILPLHATRLVKEIQGTHNCILWTFTRLASYYPGGVSLLTVTLMSLERFITLAYPYRYHIILTRVRMKIILANIWCISLALVLSNLGLVTYKVFLGLGASIVAACLVVLLSIWAWVFQLLRSHKRRISTNQTPSQTPKTGIKTSQQTYKNTRTSGAIVIGFTLCYIPLVLMFAYYWTEPESFTGIYLVTPWGETIVLLHSLFNPLIVVWRKREFRQTVQNLTPRI